MKTIKTISEEYARKGYYASGINPKVIEDIIFCALTEFKNLQQPPGISCVCLSEIKTGSVKIDCCNICGKPDEEWWGKHCL